MADLFDIALEKRFANSTEIASVDIATNDALLIHDHSTGLCMRLPISVLTSFLTGSLSSFEVVAHKGAANGYAPLDSSAKVPAANLPSYVDDVLEYADYASLPGTGETGKIYVTLDTNFEYRWSGSTYIRLVSSPGTTDALTEGSTNLYFTNARALAAAPAETTSTIGSLINGATAKATPVDADMLGLMDSAAGNVLKKLSWSNIKATLKTYFDTLYQAAGSYITSGGALGTPSSGNLSNCTFPTLNQNTTGSAATLTTARKINGVNFNGSTDITINTQRVSIAFGDLGASGSPVTTTILTATANGLWLVSGRIVFKRNSDNPGAVYSFVAAYDGNTGRSVVLNTTALVGSSTQTPSMSFSGDNLNFTCPAYCYAYVIIDGTQIISAPTTFSLNASIF